MSLTGTTVSVEQVAFEFGGSVRVFKMPQIRVWAEIERFSWVTKAGTKDFEQKGYWLWFEVSSQHFVEQVSGTATDRLDIFDQLATGTLDFYPIYDNDPAVKYTVQNASDSVSLLTTNRTRFRKESSILMEAQTRISTLPTSFDFK